MRLDEAIAALQRWFAERNLPTESLTLILNFREADEAGAFDCVLRHDGEIHRMIPYKSIDDLQNFTVRGLKIRIESPLHAEP
jgi:hypothetical protein